MHKGVIFLTKALDEDEAKQNVDNFMSDYGDGDVWDWYVIGGRWSGTLNAKTEEFFTKSEEHFKSVYPDNDHPFLTTNMVSEQKEALEKIWTELGGNGLNPYARNTYSSMGYNDDIVPLTTCIDVVNKWKKNLNEEAEALWNKILEAKEKSTSGEYDMSGYYAKRYAELKYDEFCFESNVFDIENHTNNPERALNTPDEYFAVMIDMHN